jgi:hypothetical protein
MLGIIAKFLNDRQSGGLVMYSLRRPIPSNHLLRRIGRITKRIAIYSLSRRGRGLGRGAP